MIQDYFINLSYLITKQYLKLSQDDNFSNKIVVIIPVWRNRLISDGFEPVLSHTEHYV